MTNFQDRMLASFLAAKMEEGNEDRPPPRGTLEAQGMELRARWEAYHARHIFEPGALVREKHGLGILKMEHRDDTQFIFWRYLDPGNPTDSLLVADWIGKQFINRVDCMIGHISPDGSTLITPADSATLEPAPVKEGGGF